MPVQTIRPRWGIQIEGSSNDIAEATRLLSVDAISTPDDPFVQVMNLLSLNQLRLGSPDHIAPPPAPPIFGLVPILRARSWDNIEGSENAYPVLKEAVRQLSGCLAFHVINGPLSPGTLYEFKADGKVPMYRESQLNVRVGPPTAITSSFLKSQLRNADQQDWLSRCYALFSEENSWFNVYLIAETIISTFASEHAMVKSQLIDGEQIKRVKQMANSFRHIQPSHHHPPNPPIGIEEAYATLTSSIKKLARI